VLIVPVLIVPVLIVPVLIESTPGVPMLPTRVLLLLGLFSLPAAR